MAELVNVSVDWLGTRYEIPKDSARGAVSLPAYIREFTTEEYASEDAKQGRTVGVCRVWECRCTQVVVALPDGTMLTALHADARWEGNDADGYVLTVTRVEDEAFLAVNRD